MLLLRCVSAWEIRSSVISDVTSLIDVTGKWDGKCIKNRPYLFDRGIPIDTSWSLTVNRIFRNTDLEGITMMIKVSPSVRWNFRRVQKITYSVPVSQNHIWMVNWSTPQLKKRHLKHCPGPWPGEFWRSPRRYTVQCLWTTCASASSLSQ